MSQVTRHMRGRAATPAGSACVHRLCRPLGRAGKTEIPEVTVAESELLPLAAGQASKWGDALLGQRIAIFLASTLGGWWTSVPENHLP